jgi:basic membrane lipoprotein Med (substrate-binding protein (PBP1-ABC) superfamily)
LNANEKLNEIAEELWKSPTEDNWSKFRDIIKKSKAKYYKIIYTKSLGSKEDLRKSYAELYDSKFNLITKIPIFKEVDKGVEGATINLEGLLNANKPDDIKVEEKEKNTK